MWCTCEIHQQIHYFMWNDIVLCPMGALLQIWQLSRKPILQVTSMSRFLLGQLRLLSGRQTEAQICSYRNPYEPVWFMEFQKGSWTLLMCSHKGPHDYMLTKRSWTSQHELSFNSMFNQAMFTYRENLALTCFTLALQWLHPMSSWLLRSRSMCNSFCASSSHLATNHANHMIFPTPSKNSCTNSPCLTFNGHVFSVY